MAAAIEVRSDFSSADLHRFSQQCDNLGEVFADRMPDYPQWVTAMQFNCCSNSVEN